KNVPTVERRRRDKINNWIVQLSKAIPECNIDYTKTGQSKGGILSKACDYIKELRQSNMKLGEDLSVVERLRVDNQLLRQEVCQHGRPHVASQHYMHSTSLWCVHTECGFCDRSGRFTCYPYVEACSGAERRGVKETKDGVRKARRAKRERSKSG
ncbi:hypothetical protein AMECASPLE_039659, partial [Ameca splendens]